MTVTIRCHGAVAVTVAVRVTVTVLEAAASGKLPVGPASAFKFVAFECWRQAGRSRITLAVCPSPASDWQAGKANKGREDTKGQSAQWVSLSLGEAQFV